jgi:hypothetical protein
MAKKGLKVRQIKHICDLIGKKATKSQIRRWPSVRKRVGPQRSEK